MRQQVAVKLPRQGKAASPLDVETFLREARNASGLRHPNIVQVYEADVHAGSAYLVSEFIEGRTLADRLKAGPLPYATSAELMAIVLEALHYAHVHVKKVIHRDLKPSNILIDQWGRPHLTDFGLAKREGGDSSNTNIHDNHLVGTMAYMSPEQARGESKKVDPRSDIFSAGTVLYQLLTGEFPFRGSGQMLLWQIENYDPLPPRKLHDAIDPRLEAICLRALFKDPADRYQSALEMAESLRLYLAGRPFDDPHQASPVRALVRKAVARPVRSLAMAYSVLAGVIGIHVLSLALMDAQQKIADLSARIPKTPVRTLREKSPAPTFPEKPVSSGRMTSLKGSP
jgi:serine/threonine protein kinase